MFSKFFKSYTADDLLAALKQATFSESKADSILKNIQLNHVNDEMKSFLHLSAETNSLEAVKWLIKKGLDLNLCDKNGDTALICAARSGSTEASKLLIEAGANCDIRNNKGRIAIQDAVKFSKRDIYTLLISKTKKINNIDLDKNNLLYDAIDSNNLELVSDIIENKKTVG